MELFNVLTVAQARSTLASHLPARTQAETVPLLQGLNRILARDITALEDVPGFDRSTMDGYAVRARDTFGATESLPAYVDVTGEVMMGQEAVGKLGSGQAWLIPTGGMLPPGADAVVMVEYTEELDTNTIGITKPVAPGDNMVRRGEDVAAGSVVLTAGRRLRPQDLGLLSAVGVTEVPVMLPVKVGILSTGNELVGPDQPAAPGKVRDINSYTLYGQVLEAGGIPKLYGIIQDNFDALQAAMRQALAENDMVLVSGGSSVGARDVTARVIAALGQPGVLFHGIAIKPGKPSIGAVVDGKAVFGLPGHPVSAMVVFNLLARPIIQSAGLPVQQTSFPLRAAITRNVHSATGRDDFLRVTLRRLEDGSIVADPVLGKSGLISTMVKADGVAHLPLTKEGVEAGELVDVWLF
ncbi:gephyrin-like molybdotransferase Glp [Desulfotomaculum nigrificans]|uniref:molybdopterin molybdotransferase MoeA n=1 Tax=Desulfotomaculum nigrificans TaxID=1565 RepID=UPI0001FAE8BF|nr:gephyrin-like molybdotransferase Glp [Desulfotomaculum nigrificans]